GWSVGGGNVLQLVCDLTIAADNAMFGQTGPKVGSFDAGYGSGYLARVIGHKRAKEVWFLNHFYTAQEAYEMNWINKVRSEEHTSELQSRFDLVCRLLLEKKKLA